ncbi:MAG: hypothetical protein VZR11_12470 [Succinimonas sp.]|nr:hypothetical protein [Succinimonas sp.]
MIEITKLNHMPKTFRNKENKGLQPFCSGDCRLMAGPGIKLYHRVAARISKILLTKEERPFTAISQGEPEDHYDKPRLMSDGGFHHGFIPERYPENHNSAWSQRSPEGWYLQVYALISSRICQRGDPGRSEL